MLLNCECDSITRRTVVLLIAGFQFVSYKKTCHKTSPEELSIFQIGDQNKFLIVQIHGLGSFLVALFNSKNLKSEEFSAIIVSSILTMMFAAVLVLGVLLVKYPLYMQEIQLQILIAHYKESLFFLFRNGQVYYGFGLDGPASF